MATFSDPFRSFVPCGTRYNNMPIPRIPTTTPSMIRTPIFFSRRASHTSENPPAQRYLEIPPFKKADSRRTLGKTRHYRGAKHIHSMSNLVGRGQPLGVSAFRRLAEKKDTRKKGSRRSRLRNLSPAKRSH